MKPICIVVIRHRDICRWAAKRGVVQKWLFNIFCLGFDLYLLTSCARKSGRLERFRPIIIRTRDTPSKWCVAKVVSGVTGSVEVIFKQFLFSEECIWKRSSSSGTVKVIVLNFSLDCLVVL